MSIKEDKDFNDFCAGIADGTLSDEKVYHAYEQMSYAMARYFRAALKGKRLYAQYMREHVSSVLTNRDADEFEYHFSILDAFAKRLGVQHGVLEHANKAYNFHYLGNRGDDDGQC